MNDHYILDIRIGTNLIEKIINKVDLFLKKPGRGIYHIASLNPDIFVYANRDETFRSIINQSNSILIDGIGIKIISFLFHVDSGERMTGTDLIKLLIKMAVKKKKRVMFIGGSDNTAEATGEYFKKFFPGLVYKFDPGALDIRKENRLERKRVLTKIKEFRPQFLFVAYGPPFQEYWIYNNRKFLQGIVCMGVGGSFNFYAGVTIRSPKLFTLLGLEWIWRFIFEPKRLFTKLPNYFNFCKIIVSSLIFSKRV